jgi:hypothetical protein
MSLMKRIEKELTTKETKHAFIDLACLMLFADHKSTLAKQKILEDLLSLQTDPEELLEERYQASMGKVNAKNFNPDSMIDGVIAALTTPELRALAQEFIGEFGGAKQDVGRRITQRLSH